MKKFQAKNAPKQFVCSGNVGRDGKVSTLTCKEIAPATNSFKAQAAKPQAQPGKLEVKTYFNGEDEVFEHDDGFHARSTAQPVMVIPVAPLPPTPPGPPTVCPAGPGPIQTAINLVKHNAQDDAGHTRIEIAKGTYDEFIDITNFEANANFEPRDFQNGDLQTSEGGPGFQIIGDKRPFIGFSYANGYERAGDSGRGRNYIVTTNIPGVGPYNAFVAASFGGIGGVTNLPAQDAQPGAPNGLACAPVTNTGLTGQIAIIKRGTCGFATKTKNAQNAGAAAVIIWNNNVSNPTAIQQMGGSDYSVTIPAYSISYVDGVALSNAVLANPGIRITVTPVGGAYYPQLGTNYAISKLTHPVDMANPGGNRSMITVTMTGPLPIADGNILAPPVLEQPNFNAPEVAIIPTDWVVISDSDILGNFSRSLHKITLVTGNTITFTPPVPPVGSGGVDITAPGANITFLPNVRITKSYCLPPPGLPPRHIIFRVLNVNVSITGIWIDQHPSQPFANIEQAFETAGNNALIANLVVTDVQGTSANGLGYHSANSHVNLVDGYRDDGQEKHLAVVGWSEGVGISSIGMLRGGHVFISGTNSGFSGVSIGGAVGIDSLQIFGIASIFQPGGVGWALGNTAGDYTGTEMNISSLLHIADVYGRGLSIYGGRLICDTPTIRIERCYDPASGTNEDIGAVHIFPESSMIIRNGSFVAATGKPIHLPRDTSIFAGNKDLTADFGPGFTVPQAAIFIECDGEFATQGKLSFSNNDDDVITQGSGEFSTCNETAGDCQINTNQNLDPTCPNQNLGCGAKTITLDPAKKSGSQYVYVGKEFFIYSTANCPHCLKLISGSFVGHAATVINLTRAGSFVRIKVVSPTQVLVVDSKDIKYSKTCGGGGDGSRDDNEH